MTASTVLRLTKAEIEAAKEEKHALAPKTIKELREEYNSLSSEKSIIEKKQEIIKARIAHELETRGMNDFIDIDGTPIIGYRDTTKKELVIERITEKFGADALVDCYQIKKGRSFFSKK
jgi:hypothetical protein